MEIKEAIFRRKSFGKIRQEALPRELLEELLDAAAQAPNHFLVRPWRFVVVSGDARIRLGQVMAATMRREKPEATEEALKAEGLRPLRAPVLIAVGVDLPQLERVLLVENICAAAAATQNLLLLAQARGLAAIWRTGPAAEDHEVKKFLGLSPDQPLIGFVYLGYPAEPVPTPERPGAADRTTWMED